MKSRIPLAPCIAAFGLLAAGGATGATAGAPSDPAMWMHYDMIVDLDNLPRQYSCDELWHKFHDVLWSIGARGLEEILPYSCEKSLGPQARSPRVHVEFFLPGAAPGIAKDSATLLESRATVRLAAGQPRSLDGADCQLLQQIRDTLLAALPVHVVRDDLKCKDSPGAKPGYSLTVQVMEPVTPLASQPGAS